jgi:hypothetical protein
MQKRGKRRNSLFIFPCVFLRSYHHLFPTTSALAIIPGCQRETCRRGRKEETLRGSKSVFQSSNPPVILFHKMRRDDKALLRILLLLSAIRVNRGLLCLCDEVERGIDAPHLPDDLGCGGADLSVITGPPFFRKKQAEWLSECRMDQHIQWRPPQAKHRAKFRLTAIRAGGFRAGSWDLDGRVERWRAAGRMPRATLIVPCKVNALLLTQREPCFWVKTLGTR